MAISRFKEQRTMSLAIMLGTTFVLAFSAALVAYVNSTFLKTRIAENKVGLMFTFSYLVTFVIINYYAKILRKYGNYPVFLIMLFIYAISLAAMGLVPGVPGVIFSFLMYVVSLTLIWISLDIFIHFFSQMGNTGRIRGINLTLMNMGWVLGPMSAGAIIASLGFKYLYLASACLVVPVIILVIAKRGITPKMNKEDTVMGLKKLVKRIIRRPELRDIFAIAFILQFFYTWMVIYTPIYLQNLGFSFTQIGLMFTIMLMPFVLFQFLAGYLADKFFGEAEMLTLGILIMGFASVGMFYARSFWGFAIILFLTRTGASIIEILRDSYFYKIIKSSDIEMINLFRDTGPLARIIAPVIASILISYIGIEYLFIILGIVIVSGLFFTLRMPDTK